MYFTQDGQQGWGQRSCLPSPPPHLSLTHTHSNHRIQKKRCFGAPHCRKGPFLLPTYTQQLNLSPLSGHTWHTEESMCVCSELKGEWRGAAAFLRSWGDLMEKTQHSLKRTCKTQQSAPAPLSFKLFRELCVQAYVATNVKQHSVTSRHLAVIQDVQYVDDWFVRTEPDSPWKQSSALLLLLFVQNTLVCYEHWLQHIMDSGVRCKRALSLNLLLSPVREVWAVWAPGFSSYTLTYVEFVPHKICDSIGCFFQSLCILSYVRLTVTLIRISGHYGIHVA